jgi:hypothetical protein
MKQSGIIALVILMAAVPAAAGIIRVEVENYSTFNDVGGDMIRKFALSGCSSGYVLLGLDYQDEWTGYPLSVSEFGTFAVSMVYRGEYGAAFKFRVELTGCLSGATQSVDISFSGAGYG